ncbi:MAG TPA: GatB/YqeY domain-containing protein [Verrucomicrobiales bacterium]|nr:GatB/YqeY domain-containing protein [Verrucomicrobiales bacterium]
MSTLNEKIANDLKDAMRARDQVAMTSLRALKSAVKYAAVEKLGADGELGDADILAVVRKQLKQRRDSVDQFTAGNRADLAEKELAEIAILERYLPAAMSEAEVLQLVDTVIAELGATSKKEMGQVMKVLQERSAGRADGKVLSQAVGAKLK